MVFSYGFENVCTNAVISQTLKSTRYWQLLTSLGIDNQKFAYSPRVSVSTTLKMLSLKRCLSPDNFDLKTGEEKSTSNLLLCKFHAYQYSYAYIYISLIFPVDEGYYTEKSYDGKPQPMDSARSETMAEQKRKPVRNETWTQTPQTGGHIQINYLVRSCGIFLFIFFLFVRFIL